MYLLAFLLAVLFCFFVGGWYATSIGRRGLGFICGLIPFVVSIAFTLYISEQHARELPVDVMLPKMMAPALGVMTMIHSLFSGFDWWLFSTRRYDLDEEN